MWYIRAGCPIPVAVLCRKMRDRLKVATAELIGERVEDDIQREHLPAARYKLLQWRSSLLWHVGVLCMPAFHAQPSACRYRASIDSSRHFIDKKALNATGCKKPLPVISLMCSNTQHVCADVYNSCHRASTHCAHLYNHPRSRHMCMAACSNHIHTLSLDASQQVHMHCTCTSEHGLDSLFVPFI